MKIMRSSEVESKGYGMTDVTECMVVDQAYNLFLHKLKNLLNNNFPTKNIKNKKDKS